MTDKPIELDEHRGMAAHAKATSQPHQFAVTIARAPQRQTHKKSDAILRETRCQHHDRHAANNRADHAIPALAQRCAEVRLTNESGGHTRPVRVVEFEPKRKIERETD